MQTFWVIKQCWPIPSWAHTHTATKMAWNMIQFIQMHSMRLRRFEDEEMKFRSLLLENKRWNDIVWGKEMS